MNKIKSVLFMAGVSLALAFVFSCSSGDDSPPAQECDVIFNPDKKFCYDGVVYDKCDGMVYNPTSHICKNDVATPAKCSNSNGENYNPLTQECCGDKSYNLLTQRCTNGIVETKCGSGWYNQVKQSCTDNIIYEKCNGNSYNPLTQRCINGSIVETACGRGWYNQVTQFCIENMVYDKCNGNSYNPPTQRCINGIVETKCSFDGWYNPATQLCTDNIIDYKCNGNSYNPLTQYCSNGTMKEYGGFVTYEEQTYKTVVIGTQTWMAENLNYNANGVCYDNNPAACDRYGRLYNWATAMALPDSCNYKTCSGQINANHKGICPEGWHIPSFVDWNVLGNFAGGRATAGTKLKAADGWDSQSVVPSTNDFGFSALPGGSGGYDSSFGGAGISGFWWSTSDFGAQTDFRAMSYNDEEVYYFYRNKTALHSVRCLQD